MANKDYIVVVQCHIVKERCSGYYCEQAFSDREGMFTGYSKDHKRFLSMTCGGCCGRALQRKLSNFLKFVKKKEKIGKDRIVVHFSTCISHDNYHAPPCPHKDYLKSIICDKLGLDLIEGTRISELSEKRRKQGRYISG